jgi:hypothetical protein
MNPLASDKRAYSWLILWIPVAYIVLQLCFGVVGLYAHTFYGTRVQLHTTLKITPLIPPLLMTLAWYRRHKIGKAVFILFNLGMVLGWCCDLLGVLSVVGEFRVWS